MSLISMTLSLFIIDRKWFFLITSDKIFFTFNFVIKMDALENQVKYDE